MFQTPPPVNPYVTGSSPVARATIDSRSISAMSRTVFLEKTKPFARLSLSSKVKCQISLSHPAHIHNINIRNILIF